MIALASDFDGTLFFDKEGFEFKEEDIKAISRFQDAGHLFGICTGRPLIGIREPVKERIHFDFYIVSSGAVILDRDLQVIDEKCLSREVLNHIYEDFKDVCRVAVQANQKIYSFHGLIPMPIKQDIISSPDEIIGDELYGLSLETDNEEKAFQVCQRIQEKYGDFVDAYQNIRYVDVVSKGCSKGLAIQNFIQKDHIDLMGGIGDSYNDLPMLEVVDEAFTFHHSPEVVKKSADHLVDSVAQAIDILMASYENKNK